MVAGEAPVVLVRVQHDDFDAAAESARLTEGRQDVGAVVTFTGLCRNEGGRLSALELEHYPGMAEAEIRRICVEAADRFSLLGISALHRVGRLSPGDNIVFVAAAAPHRQAAFDGAAFVMDYLKTSAPFWKKEHLAADGEGGWVDAKDADDSARAKWQAKT